MKYSFILFIAIVFGINGCYEDKGNYTYKDLKQIEIKKISINKLTLGDTLRITPEFTYSTPDTVMSLKYTWTLKDEEISHERNLVYVPQDILNTFCTLKVEDIDNGTFFYQIYNINVGYKYEKGGFLVLSEKGGKASLSFLPLAVAHQNAFNEIDSMAFSVVDDVYKKESGEDFNGKPMKVHEHFCSDKTTKGQTLVVLDNGLVDVNSLTFRKEVTGDEMFVDGWPNGMKPTNALFMQWVDLIQDQEGHLYTRVKSTQELFHSEYFLPQPLAYEGKVMEKINIILGKYSFINFCLLYDGSHNRYLGFMDFRDTFDGINAVGMINPLTEGIADGGYPEHFVPLENLGDYKPLYTGYWVDNTMGKISYFMLLEKGGNYYHQEFSLSKDWYTTDLLIEDMSFQEIPGLGNVINENSVVYALPYIASGKYVFISNGNSLYLYDREVPKNGAKLFYTFDGNVTAMDSEFYNSVCLGVGLDNGRLAVLKMAGAKNAQTNKDKLFWESPAEVDLGNIKSIRYKVQGGNGWN